MKKVFSIFLFLIILIVSTKAQAQNRFSVALKLGYGTGAYEATYTGLNPGKLALRIDINYSLLPVLDAYAAYTRTGFKCEEGHGFCHETSVKFTSSGFTVGLRLNRGHHTSIWIPWLKAGLAYRTLEWAQNKQNYRDGGLGFEIGVGFALPATDHIKIVPAINYTRYSVTGANGIDQGVAVLTALIGARYEF